MVIPHVKYWTRPQHPLVLKIAFTVVFPAAALLGCVLTETWLAPAFETPFVAAVAIVAWRCGTAYAIAAAALSLFALEHFFTSAETAAAWDLRLLVRALLFIATTGTIVVLIEWLYRTQAKWAEAERRHRSLAELIPFGGWMSDPVGNMISVSESFLNTFKATAEEVRGLGWLDLIVPEQREQVKKDWLICMQRGYFWDYEYRMASKDEQDYVVLSRGVPVHDPDGRVRSWVGMHLDITEIERSAEQKVAQARDLARFNAELEQLAYVSSHDLQEPLRTIASYLQLLSRRYKGKLDSVADTFIDYAVDGATRLKTLLQDLMLLQQVGKNTRPKSVCSLETLASNAIERLQSLIDERSATILCEDLPSVLGDAPDLTQLLTSLIENAIRYSRPGVPPEVTLSGVREGPVWIISVADNGIGIEQEYLDRIFHIFQRLHPQSTFPGTGIGLAICKKIVEVHGGRIWTESTPGHGTTFHFTLPAALPRDPAALPAPR